MLARILVDGKITATTNAAEITAAIAAGTKVWVELERQSPEGDALLRALAIHPLTIEDIWGSGSQPKIDDFPTYLYVVVHGIGSARGKKLDLVEVDALIGETWLITHDRAGLVADDVGTELDHSPRLLGKGVAWLAHAILDRVVDRYLPVIDELDAEIDLLENDVLEKAGTARGRGVLTRILAFKRTLQGLRRMSIHQREILLRLSRGEYEEIPSEALPFFRDVYDHFLRIQDVTEGYRDLVTSALDAYLSVQSNRMNEVVKTLTLMSTIMLPLTFIAGVYGMNFKSEASPYNMPELSWFYGYPFVIGLMAVVTLMIIGWFRHKGYLGGNHRDESEPDDRLVAELRGKAKRQARLDDAKRQPLI
ncbi:MAG: magnesium/cobalt transporter CorA [Myxococcota bacterium]|nr:magnesium/cobalt transporter CorA [Myxococcota bacterium]